MSKRFASAWEDRESLVVYQRILVEGKPEELEGLPQNFLDTWISKNSGAGVFHYAASHGLSPETTVPFLVARGQDINALSGKKHSLMCHAFNRDADLCLRWFNALRTAGWEVSNLPGGGSSLLARAIEFKRVELVEGLILSGASKAREEVLTEQSAQSGADADVVRITRLEPEDEPTPAMHLLEAMLPATAQDITRLFLCSIARGRFRWSHHFMEKGADVFFRFEDGATPLHLLARQAYPGWRSTEEIMNLAFDLVRLGVDPLHRDGDGLTASDRLDRFVSDRSSINGAQCIARWQASLRNGQAHAMMSSSSTPSGLHTPRPRL